MADQRRAEVDHATRGFWRFAFFQRACAARFAIADRRAFESFAARALPPWLENSLRICCNSA